MAQTTSPFDPDWTYTFCDALTGAELATLPATNVNFEKVINGTGKASLTIPTTDPAVRALDPWSATEPRRTLVFIDYQGHLLWGGMVWQRQRQQDTPGLVLTAATLESWLATQILLDNHDLIGGGGYNGWACEVWAQILNNVQAQPGAGMGLHVVSYNNCDYDPHNLVYANGSTGNGMGEFGGTPDPIYSFTPGWYPDPRPAEVPYVPSSYGEVGPWPRTEVKDYLTRMSWFLQQMLPVEFRVDFQRRPDNGQLARLLLVGESRIGRTTDVTGLHVDYPGTLLSWTDVEDGTIEGNAAVGAISDPANSSSMLWSYWTAGQVGGAVEDEVAEGYPLMMRPVTSSGSGITTQAQLDTAVQAEVGDALTQGRALSNFTLRIDQPAVWCYDVGDDLDLTIAHPSYPEFPGQHEASVRILGKKVTPRAPGTPDSVSLTVVDAGSGRLPRSTTLVAHMRDLQRRIRALETTPG